MARLPLRSAISSRVSRGGGTYYARAGFACPAGPRYHGAPMAKPKSKLGLPDAIDTDVRYCVVSTSITLVPFEPGVKVSGDQLCIIPRGRTL